MNEPAPPPAPMPQRSDLAKERKAVEADASAGTIDVQVRSDFRSTALWKPDVVTDANGTATVSVKFPEALTRGAPRRGRRRRLLVGIGTSTTRTNLPLLVRLQAPRFFVAGDRATVSGVVNNNTNEAITVTPSLEIEGNGLKVLEAPAEKTLRVEAHAEARADWTVSAVGAGEVKLRVTARNAQLGDAMEKSFVVYEHGIDKLIARSGRSAATKRYLLELPRERRATDLTIQIAPILAATMLDALPYLVEFPYGCTEQTMSRFLPAVIVARRWRSSDSIRTSATEEKARRRDGRRHGPVVRHAAQRRRMGWWKDGSSDDFMPAYVLWGFSLAREAGCR